MVLYLPSKADFSSTYTILYRMEVNHRFSIGIPNIMVHSYDINKPTKLATEIEAKVQKNDSEMCKTLLLQSLVGRTTTITTTTTATIVVFVLVGDVAIVVFA